MSKILNRVDIINLNFAIMGMSPKTKAECDREIAAAERRLASEQSNYEMMKARCPENWSKESVAHQKSKVETVKGEIKSLKALRKTLK